MCWAGLLFARDSEPDGLRSKGGSYRRSFIDELKKNLNMVRHRFRLAE